MTDHDPLAALKALAKRYATEGAKREAVGKPAWPNNVARDLHDALTEAQEAMNALMAERDETIDYWMKAADAAQTTVQQVARDRNYAMRERDEERRAKEGNIAALNAACAERDQLREALEREVQAIAAMLRTALAQPATDEEAGQ